MHARAHAQITEALGESHPESLERLWRVAEALEQVALAAHYPPLTTDYQLLAHCLQTRQHDEVAGQ